MRELHSYNIGGELMSSKAGDSLTRRCHSQEKERQLHTYNQEGCPLPHRQGQSFTHSHKEEGKLHSYNQEG